MEKAQKGYLPRHSANMPISALSENNADEVEAETNEYLKTLTDEKLQSVFDFKRWDGKPDRKKIGDILMHVIEEEIHHRGELLCIFWQSDIKPPYVSYMGYVEDTGQA